MPDYLKISELPVASSVAPTDQIELNQAGTSRSTTVALLHSVSPGGDVSAYGGFTPSSGTAVVIVFGTVITGNSGSWLNLTNGRYTPPAGRYFIQCNGTIIAPGGGNAGWTLSARKNGVAITGAGQVGTGSASFNIPITVGLVVDANGTDYFEFTGTVNVAGAGNIGSIFTAYPVL